MILINGEKKPANEIDSLPKRAVFQLMGQYTRTEYDKKNRKDRKINAQSFSFPTSYVMYDPVKGENVEVRYAVTETPSVSMDGKQFKKYQPHKLFFQKNGRFFVETKDKDLYWFMMNCPALDKGDGKGNPSFFLVSPEKTATQKRENQLLEHRALSLLIGENKRSMYEQRRLVEAFNLGNIDEMDDNMINTVLVDHAKADPASFIQQIGSQEINIKVTLSTARKAKYIDYNISNRKWVWGVAVPGSAARDIVVVPVSRHPEEYFIEWLLRTDNSGVMNEIQLLVKGSEDKKVKLDEVKSRVEHNYVDPIVTSTTHFADPASPITTTTLSGSKNGITEELKARALAADMPLQGIGTMKLETFMAKLEKFEKKKEARQLV
jgi:hypothetical protein